ncbi:hypothetical protein UA45_15055 [Morganella morganii]|uniref:Uncharacterized protein n=1 Tax=Morganella morganii TaxID=582 RepID=A0A0D8L582_MORMO|nr:hypothetical protein UA45_15055 [Morganella morganii]
MSNEKFSVKFIGLIDNIGRELLFRISFIVGENNITRVYKTAEKGIFCSNINKKPQIGDNGSE